jgi:polyvinyl alcohol dehydrogenase (cytochrome)
LWPFKPAFQTILSGVNVGGYCTFFVCAQVTDSGGHLRMIRKPGENFIAASLPGPISALRRILARRERLPLLALPVLLTLVVLVSLTPIESRGGGQKSKTSARKSSWPMFGKDVASSHYNPDETALNPGNVARLKPKWIFETEADVSSQPTVVDGVVYFGSWDGKEYAVDAATGKKIWDFDCGLPSRAGAAYDDGVVYFGDLGGRIYGVDAKTGQLKWKVRIDPHPDAVATSSPVIYKGIIYIGVASHEEGALLKKKPCCTFRGGVLALDAKTGKQIWRFYTIPEEAKKFGTASNGLDRFGPAGGAVWSTVSLDPGAGRVYVTTGNQYEGEQTKFTDSIIALTMDTGKPIWTYQANPSDVFVIGCQNCGPDSDFGAPAVMFAGPGGKRLVGAGQKSGWFHAVDADTGAPVWHTEIGPGSALGGIEFGDASDGEHAYAALASREGGAIAMLDGATGKIVWKTPSPDKKRNYGPLTVTGKADNRLVFAGSTGGFIRAYDGKDGRILWEFDTGGAIGGGPTVLDGVVYVGSGYTFLRVGNPNNKLYAFSLDGK